MDKRQRQIYYLMDSVVRVLRALNDFDKKLKLQCTIKLYSANYYGKGSFQQ